MQQALLLLRNQGVLRDAPGRGLVVASLDLEQVSNRYDIRAVMEGLACRKAVERIADRAKKQGRRVIQNGRKAVDARLGRRDDRRRAKFHDFIYGLSADPRNAPTMDAQWTYTQR